MQPTQQDITAFTSRTKLRISEKEIRERFRLSKRGLRITYHIGFLCVDAESDVSLREIRKLVSDWSNLGFVSLVQRKRAGYCYEYYAEVR